MTTNGRGSAVQDNWPQCFALILKEEGGYSNDPHDKGGMTNHGVTHIDWAAWVGHEPTEDEMKALTPDDVMPLYKKRYWDVIQGDELPYGVDYALLDFGVNSGTSRAVKHLQAILGVTQDGIIGNNTMNEISRCDHVDLSGKICDDRLKYLQALSDWQYFGKGWGSRVVRVKEISAKMASS